MSIARLMQMGAAAPTGPEGAWDLSYAHPSPSWDISKAFYTNIFESVSAQENTPNAVFFKPDGTGMYILGEAGDDVNQYNLSRPWDVSSSSYIRAQSVAAQETIPTGLFFKPDGTKMYIVGRQNVEVIEYNLSTAWDVSSETYSTFFSVNSQETNPQDLFFKPDGTKMYVVGGTDAVYEYSLSTAWSVSSASYVQSFSVAAQDSNPQGLFFKPDGTTMYILGEAGDDVNEYSLSTAWDVSSASFSGKVFSVASQDSFPTGIFFKPDGGAFYVVGRTSDAVYQYSLNGLSVSANELYPYGVFFKPDGTKMYVSGNIGDDVDEYNLSTAWDIFSATYVQSFSFSAQSTNVRDIFFKPDGTKMYMIEVINDSVFEYNLSAAWDVSSATYGGSSFSVALQEGNPFSIFLKPDGTKMYVTGSDSDAVHEYNLSTAWDVSSASFLQSFSVSAQELSPSGVFFKDDGAKMYISGTAGDDINEYSLSTAWDVSSASYTQNFSLMAQTNNPGNIFFKPDGTQFFVTGITSGMVFSFNVFAQP